MVLETATTAATLPAGAVSRDRGDIFDAADLNWIGDEDREAGGGGKGKGRVKHYIARRKTSAWQDITLEGKGDDGSRPSSCKAVSLVRDNIDATCIAVFTHTRAGFV